MTSPTEDLFAALSRSDLDAARIALRAGADPNAAGPSGGETPLMRVRLCREPQPMLALLLEHGGDPSVTDLAGRTALHHLIACNEPAVVDMLLRHGADPLARDADGARPLDAAMQANIDGPVLQRLLAAMPPLADDDRTRLLFRHLQRAEFEHALQIVAEGVQLAPLSDGAYPPLFLAARYGDARVINALLDAGADIDALFGAGETALFQAARYGHAAAVDTLLRRGTSVGIVNASGSNALHAASGSFHARQSALLAVVQRLLRSPIDPLRRNRCGYWPRALARATGNHRLTAVLPPAPGEPPVDRGAERISTVEVGRLGSHRLRWRPNDILQPFALEENLGRDEWGGSWLSAGELAERAGGLLGEPGLAWFAPFVERFERGEPVTLDEVRAAHRRSMPGFLETTGFRRT